MSVQEEERFETANKFGRKTTKRHPTMILACCFLRSFLLSAGGDWWLQSRAASSCRRLVCTWFLNRRSYDSNRPYSRRKAACTHLSIPCVRIRSRAGVHRQTKQTAYDYGHAFFKLMSTLPPTAPRFKHPPPWSNSAAGLSDLKPIGRCSIVNVFGLANDATGWAIGSDPKTFGD